MRRLFAPGLAALARFLRSRRTPADHFARLSDHHLADIGLYRDQIDLVAEMVRAPPAAPEHRRPSDRLPCPDGPALRPAI